MRKKTLETEIKNPGTKKMMIVQSTPKKRNPQRLQNRPTRICPKAVCAFLHLTFSALKVFRQRIFRMRYALPFVVLLLGGETSVADEEARSSSPATGSRVLIAAVPVWDWLVVGESTTTSVQPRLQTFKGIVSKGTFAYTGGQLINFGSALGIENEEDLRLVSLGFDQDRRLVSVTQLYDRGYQDSHVESVIKRLVSRYRAYGEPIAIMDARGEAEDRYILFDLGRYVVSINVPQSGRFVTLKVATFEVYKDMVSADRTADLLLPYLYMHTMDSSFQTE